jgi:hypothetical protein
MLPVEVLPSRFPGVRIALIASHGRTDLQGRIDELSERGLYSVPKNSLLGGAALSALRKVLLFWQGFKLGRCATPTTENAPAR